jgi:hypothetical protein
LNPAHPDGGVMVFRRDLTAGTTVWVDQPVAGGTDSRSQTGVCAVSDNGRYVLFESDATDLVANDPGDPHLKQVFLRDVQEATTTRESRHEDHSALVKNTFCADMTSDASVLLLQAISNVSSEDTSGGFDAFLRYTTPDTDP